MTRAYKAGDGPDVAVANRQSLTAPVSMVSTWTKLPYCVRRRWWPWAAAILLTVAVNVLLFGSQGGCFDYTVESGATSTCTNGRAAYDYAARVCETDPAEMLLVAAHPWDIHGASRAGLRTAWLNRTGTPYPDYFDAPDHIVETLAELVPTLDITGPG